MFTFTNVALTPLPTGVVLGFRPNSGTYNEGVTTQTYSEKNDEGVNTPTELVDTERAPTFTFGVQRLNPEMIAVKMARALTAAAGTGLYIFNKTVDDNTVAAVTTGQQGFGAVADDANCVGSVYEDGQFTALTREAFTGFVEATAGNRFALGLNGALKFSDALIGKRVVILIPYPTTDSLSLGLRRAQFRVKVAGVYQEEGVKKVFNITLKRAAVNIQESGSIEDGADSYTVTVADLSGDCAAQMDFHNAIPVC